MATVNDSHHIPGPNSYRFLAPVRRLTGRYGAARVVTVATALSVALSLLLTVAANLWLRGHVPVVEIVIGGGIPLLLSPLFLYGFVALVQQLDLAEADLRRLASEDDLTGAHNRRYILALAAREWERSRRYGGALSLLMVDVDHFKRVNDTCGHAVGDGVLQTLVRTCGVCLRRTDAVGRLGGEEFLVLLPDTDEHAAAEIGERLRAVLASSEMTAAGQPLRITVSVGVASRHPDTASLEHLLKRADDALYAAKAAGRNQLKTAKSDAPHHMAGASA